MPRRMWPYLKRHSAVAGRGGCRVDYRAFISLAFLCLPVFLPSKRVCRCLPSGRYLQVTTILHNAPAHGRQRYRPVQRRPHLRDLPLFTSGRPRPPDRPSCPAGVGRPAGQKKGSGPGVDWENNRFLVVTLSADLSGENVRRNVFSWKRRLRCRVFFCVPC